VFAAANNIFDINQHPIFIALDQTPCIANPTFPKWVMRKFDAGRESSSGCRDGGNADIPPSRDPAACALGAICTAAADPVTVRDASTAR